MIFWMMILIIVFNFVAFCSFFPGSLTVVHRNRQLKSGRRHQKSGVRQKKVLELDNSTVFHKGKKQKSSRARHQNDFLIIWPHFSTKDFPKCNKLLLSTTNMCQIYRYLEFLYLRCIYYSVKKSCNKVCT